MNALDKLQKLVSNDLKTFRFNYFPNSESFLYNGFNHKRGGNFEEKRYKFSSLDCFNDFIFAGNIGGEKPSDYAKSVHLYNLLFQKEGIKCFAHGFDVNPVFGTDNRPTKDQCNFENFLDEVVKNSMQFLLLHVTDPYKLNAYEYALKNNISMSESARISGVVNPFLFDKKGKLYSENVDGYALMEAIENKMKVDGKTILLIGAGGAASSIALEAVNRLGDGKIIIANRTQERAHELSEKLKSYKNLNDDKIISGGVELISQNKNIDVIISAITENPYITESIANSIPKNTLFVDINYGDRAVVASIGKRTGHDAIDGTPMVYYGVKRTAELAFEKKLGKHIKESTFDFIKKEAGL